MKKTFILISILLMAWTARAHHIIGGEMSYAFISSDGKNYTYEITLKAYRGCEPADKSHAPLDPYVSFSIFDNRNDSLIGTVDQIGLNGPYQANRQRSDPCILNPPAICYQIGYYKAKITVPLNKDGYTVAFQRCCRDDRVLNADTRNNVGATYFTVIPGTETGIPGDNGPVFSQEEAVLVCSRGQVDYSYAATDADGDSLTYAFHPAYVGGTQSKNVPIPTDPPPYSGFSYRNGFSAMQPLGPGVTIDPRTGKVSGRTRLQAGIYDVCVAVYAHRNGRVIATHLRDFQVEVHDCRRLALADIPPLYNDCRGMTISFPDHSTAGRSYLWNFGDGDTSHAYAPVHEYPDTGIYHVWLKVDPASSCGDSIGAEVRIYPGLKTSFGHEGNCRQFPVSFTDLSHTPYGTINSRRWAFGDGDTSRLPAPDYRYSQAGTYPVILTVGTDKGCLQSDTQSVRLYDKPDLAVTPDTMLCLGDRVQLHASGPEGDYSWEPLYRISPPRSPDPVVSPLTDTTYRVTLTDGNGCQNTDSVRIRVRARLVVDAGGDTTVCAGDPVKLYAVSDGNYSYRWTDGSGTETGKSLAITTTAQKTGTYYIDATLGTCETKDSMHVRVVPYPDVRVSPDTVICYGDRIQLRASGGAFYHWSPARTLSDPDASSPFATPTDSTLYTLTVTDTAGCPKPSAGRILVGVIPPIRAFAGDDTIATFGRPFPLHATGGNSYTWSPPTGLSDPYIADPVATGYKDMTYRVKVQYMPEGCLAYDTVRVRFVRGPAIYVPSAFTPNGDGKNDIFRPIPVGIMRLDYFQVYDRWGRLVFRTSAYMQGWDGTCSGAPATPGAYVWVVKGENEKGRAILRKGTVLLIR